MRSPFETSKVPPTLVAAAAIVAIVGAMVLVLTVGGGGESGDITYRVGGTAQEPPDDQKEVVSVADLVGATVEPNGKELVFSAEMVEEVPPSMEGASIDWHWDISSPSGERWIVSASLNIALNAAVLGQDSAYSATTIDGSMPGSIRTDGDRLLITLDPSAIKGFPETFSWTLSTVVTVDREDPEAGRAEDSFPDSGEVSYPAG